MSFLRTNIFQSHFNYISDSISFFKNDNISKIMWSSNNIFTVSVNKTSDLLQLIFTKEATLGFHFFTNKLNHYFLKRKLHTKLIQLVPLIVFFLCLTLSLPFIIHLFYFIHSIIYFILLSPFFLLSPPYFQLSKRLTQLLCSLPVALFPFHLPIILLIIFDVLTPHPFIRRLTLFWGWHSCLTVCQSLSTYSYPNN